MPTYDEGQDEERSDNEARQQPRAESQHVANPSLIRFSTLTLAAMTRMSRAK